MNVEVKYGLATISTIIHNCKHTWLIQELVVVFRCKYLSDNHSSDQDQLQLSWQPASDVQEAKIHSNLNVLLIVKTNTYVLPAHLHHQLSQALVLA